MKTFGKNVFRRLAANGRKSDGIERIPNGFPVFDGSLPKASAAGGSPNAPSRSTRLLNGTVHCFRGEVSAAVKKKTFSQRKERDTGGYSTST